MYICTYECMYVRTYVRVNQNILFYVHMCVKMVDNGGCVHLGGVFSTLHYSMFNTL